MEVIAQNYKKSLHNSQFTKEQVSIIWDFYVTKSIAKTATQRRSASDYDLKKLPWDEMVKKAELDKENIKILMADNINKTIELLGLKTEEKKEEISIEINTPKIACIRSYTIHDYNPPKSKLSDAECVLTHIRNSFAHGLTYFFDNGYMMLEDKDPKKITARIIIKQQTLLDWISIIDKNKKFYDLHKE